ncbi:bifunctional DNA primase/polymerase [Deinococcus sedimenti]|uniref:SF4 helicase domain-containing protein n=1 Tax=Deinococcus sedimenti TaxID=1867090 RepID=A0ABQ2SCN1_9DEIO|nr:bifunctional DNA primase/polymerase [Deinococcus sedimenti]GGS10801.1 hypothetical protein GCM10008960_41030 [Deinococcus sedimenti]
MTRSQKAGPLLTAALAALDRGWSVLPVQAVGAFAKRPHFVLTETGHQDQEDDKIKPSWKPLQTTPATPEQVSTWFAKESGKGVAIVTGTVSNVIVIDFDGPHGEALRQQWNLPVHVRTGSGGSHVYFEHPGWPVSTLNSKAKRELGQRWPGLDIRGDGGYALIPPSINPSGPYIWEGTPGDLLPLSRLPDDVRIFLGLMEAPKPPEPRSVAPVTPYQGSRQDNQGRPPGELLVSRALDQVNSGEGRNNAGMWLALQLRDNGYSRGEAQDVMRSYVAQVPVQDTHGRHDPYTENEAATTLASAFSRPARQPWEERKNSSGNNVVSDVKNPSSGTDELLTFVDMSDGLQPPPVPAISETGTGPVILTGDSAFQQVTAALQVRNIDGVVARRALTPEEIQRLIADRRALFVLSPSGAQERAFDAAGVEWYPLHDLQTRQDPETLNQLLTDAMTAAWEVSLQGSVPFLEHDLLALADARLNRGGHTYPTGLTAFDEAIGGGFYDGLHVLGGVTGGGKTALALAIAQFNAQAGRPVLYVTYEQSRYELWGRVISSNTGVPLRQLRTGGTAQHPVSELLRQNQRYQELTRGVAPHFTVIEGDGFEGGAWGTDRIAAQVRRMKAAYNAAPLVILDYLQRMPSGSDKEKRHQIDEVVMGLQVRLGRELNTPVLLISSVGRGKYGELVTAPLEERLGVFKESGGVEYTAYTASLLYPLGAAHVQALGLEEPPVPGSGRAALKGLWKYLVLDLAKNREGEAPRQWVLRWYPATGRFELQQAIDPEELAAAEGSKRKARTFTQN